jgi:hypothetical protein
LAKLAGATGVEAGALFRYTLAAPLDVKAHGSALLPFVQEQVAVRRIAWFHRPGTEARSAVYLTNTTKQTLPPGTLAVFSAGGFAGESELDRLKPRQSRIVEFGADLDVKLRLKRKRHTDHAAVLEVRRKWLVEHFERHHRRTFEIENRSGSPRTVYVGLDFVDNSRVEGADEFGYDTERRRALAVYQVGARKKRTVVLQVWEGLRREHRIAKLTAKHLGRIAASPKLNASQRRIVRKSRDLLRSANSRTRDIKANAEAIRHAHYAKLKLQDSLESLRETDSDAYERLAERVVAAAKRESRYYERTPHLVAAKRKLIRRARHGLRALNRAGKRTRSRTR